MDDPIVWNEEQAPLSPKQEQGQMDSALQSYLRAYSVLIFSQTPFSFATLPRLFQRGRVRHSE